MGKNKDLKEHRFGKLVAKEYYPSGSVYNGKEIKRASWVCLCDCGNTRLVETRNLLGCREIHCCTECAAKEGAEKLRQFDLTNQQFNDWKVLEYIGMGKYLCQCKCGFKEVKAAYDITSGRSKMCNNCAGHVSKLKAGDIVGDCTLEYSFVMGDKTYWHCRCKCGSERNIRAYELNKEKQENIGFYKCKHKVHPNMRIGKLEILARDQHGNCLCKCDCGNIIETRAERLMGNQISCGCIRDKNKFSKEDVEWAIKEYKENHNNDLPFIQDICDILGVGQTACRKYIKEYELQDSLNKVFDSKYEREIFELLDKAELHNREALKPREIDIYLPDKRIGIEINGDYWHRADNKGRMYHQNKQITAINKNIRLIQIYESEWLNERKHDIITQVIKGINDSSIIKNIEANSLLISEHIEKEKILDFLNKNYVDEAPKFQASICLVDNNTEEIISTMLFNNDIENNRYELVCKCTKLNNYVKGGYEKILRYFYTRCKALPMITKCNISKDDINEYYSLGFQLQEISEPNERWTNAKFEEVTDIQDEETMRQLGYFKICDCGNYILEYKINKKGKHNG